MKLVLTLLARDEADIVDAQIAFHLNAGVDFVVATDNRSQDGTTEILESYAREGYLHLIREDGDDLRMGEWVTRMARMAAADFSADWVINSDADEFYWPRGSDLKEMLAAIPSRYGLVRAFVRTFLPRLDDDVFFAEAMTVRLTPQAPMNHPATIFRPGAKLVHRADPNVNVGHGTHTLSGTSLVPLRGWYPLELLHFPFRTARQSERKLRHAWSSWQRNPDSDKPHYLEQGYAAIREGRLRDFLGTFTVDDQKLARGLAEDSLVVDKRLRDALRALRADADGTPRFRLPTEGPPLEITPPDLADDARYAVDAAVLDEADVTRLQRHVDELEARLTLLERHRLGGLPAALGRRATRILARGGPVREG